MSTDLANGKTGVEALRYRINVMGKSYTWLAEELGVTRGAIGQWKEVPPKRAKDVSRLTQLPLETLCPDIF